MMNFQRPRILFSTLSLTWSVACLSASSFVYAADEKLKTEVQDLRYGVALYHYYQQDYLPAITELLIADARDGIQGHGNNPELIAAGLGLAFGMEHNAEQLFNRILADNSRPQTVRDAAWFYLGKLAYTRQNWALAASCFQRVSAQLPSNLLAEMHALQINLMIKNNDLSNFSLKSLEKESLTSWEPYSLYNIGAAYARAGDLSKAKTFFAELIDKSTSDDPQSRQEYLSLTDKTHVALGYSLLNEKSYLGAIEEFKKVRLTSIDSNQALLGYGWAAMAQEKYAEALRPWQVLQTRSLIYPAAQEALLALPFAYEKLNATGEALAEYEKAENLLGAEINLVRDMRKNLTADELLILVGSKAVNEQEFAANESQSQNGQLTAMITDDGQNWLKIGAISVIKTRSIYLRELFNQNNFQTAVLDLRDLLRLQKLLKDWQPKLFAYRELLEQKQAWRKQKEQQLAQVALSSKQSTLESNFAELQARSARILEQSDYMALADGNTRKTYKLVEQSEARLSRLKAEGQDISEYEDKLWLLRGLLQWNAAQQFTANQQTLSTELQTTEAALADVKNRSARMDAIVASSTDLQPFFVRIDQQQKEVDAQLEQVNGLIAIRAEALRQQVDKQLAQHDKRLGRYLAQAHLAVARLYDNSLRNPAP